MAVANKNAVFWDVVPCGLRATQRNIAEDGILHFVSL
jgi:hypothetical protein